MKNNILSLFAICLAFTQVLCAQSTSIFVFPDYVENNGEIIIEGDEQVFVQIHNDGNTPIEITSATTTGNFTINAQFPFTIAAGQDAEFGVQYTPTTNGDLTGELQINAQNLGLIFTGSLIATLPEIEVEISDNSGTIIESGDTILFEPAGIGSQFVSLKNIQLRNGNSHLTDLKVTTTGDFTSYESQQLPTELSPHDRLDLTLDFRPTELGERSGTITISADQGGVIFFADLSGTATLPKFEVTSHNDVVEAGDTILFEPAGIGSQFTSLQHIQFINGNSHLTNLIVTTTGDFNNSEFQYLPTELSPNDRLDFTLDFRPTELGERSGTITISADQGGVIFFADLSGNATLPEFEVSESSGTIVESGDTILFEPAGIGSQFTSLQHIQFINGNSHLTNLIVTTTGDFNNSEFQYLPTVLSPHDRLDFILGFRPTELGERSGTITISADQGGVIFFADLSGTATLPEFEVTNHNDVVEAGDTILFEPAEVGSQFDSSRSIDFRNGDSHLTSLKVVTTGEFSIFDLQNLPTELTPNESMSFHIDFRPTDTGDRAGTITITADQGGILFSANLSGQGFTTYNTIATDAGLTGDDRDPDAIVFSDGLPNLLKYAFNLDLSKADNHILQNAGNSGLPSNNIIKQGAESVFQMQYIERVDSDITYTPQISESLEGYTEIHTKTSEPINSEWNRITVTSPITPDTPKAFFRVHVEQN